MIDIEASILDLKEKDTDENWYEALMTLYNLADDLYYIESPESCDYFINRFIETGDWTIRAYVGLLTITVRHKKGLNNRVRLFNVTSAIARKYYEENGYTEKQLGNLLNHLE